MAIAPQYFVYGEHKQENLKVKDLVLRIDGKSDEIFRDVDDTLADGVNTLMQRVDSLSTEVQNLTSQLSTSQAQLDGANIKLAEVQKQLEEAQNHRMDDNAIALEIKKRAETWDLVEPFLQGVAANNGKEFRRDGALTVRQIQELYIKAKDPNLKLDGKDEAYITALWDYLAPTPGENQPTLPPKPQNRVDSLYEWLTKGESDTTTINQGGKPGNEGIRIDRNQNNARADYANRIENSANN